VLTTILLTRLGPYRYAADTESSETIQPIQVASGA
jgi:hypothetical protein